jgi:hypothetical protein
MSQEQASERCFSRRISPPNVAVLDTVSMGAAQ